MKAEILRSQDHADELLAVARELARPVPVDLDAFHEHLGACEQCRSHPFNLCTAGRALLARAAMGSR